MKGEEIAIATQNTRGLGQGFIGKRKRKEIQNIFQNTTPKADILLLQETKLSEEASLKQARFIETRGGSSLWNAASFSAQSGRYTGGTSIVLSERLVESITHHGVLFPGRAQYVVLNLSARLQLGIINVYGFNDTGPRAMLWNHLAQVPLPVADWVLAGDFNNIESLQDKQGGSNKTSIGGREMEAWNRLLVRLSVRDSFNLGAFRRKSTKAFTWTNGHNDDTMVQTRIDRIYVPSPLADTGGTTKILPEIPDISDHSGMIMYFNNAGSRKHRHPCFNKGLLKHPESKAALLSAWRECMDDETLDSWNDKIVAANRALQVKSEELTRSQKKQWKDTYLAQFDEIVEAEDELQRNLGSKEARDRLSDAQAKLHEVRLQKFQFKESDILSKWTRVGDRCTKEFFEHFTGHRKQVTITQLLDGDNLLESHILEFYEKLYVLDEQVEYNEAARIDCLQFLKQSVTEEHNQELLKPLTQEEVSEAVKQLPAGKAPGIDTIPAEFYQEAWEEIQFDIFNFVLESISQEGIAEELNISKIALIPKSEDRLRVQYYRPISLLNTLYKVVAKVYANRMKPLLHNWILPSQTGFVPNRCILDNVFLAFEAMEWTLEN